MLTNRHFGAPVLLSILIVLTLFVSGCWGGMQIENRGFLYGIAIDYVTSPDPKGLYDLPHVTQEAGARKYQVTYELVKLSLKTEGEFEDDADGEHLIFTAEGESVFHIMRAIAAKTYSKLFLEDIQIIVFSEAVAKEGIGDLLDYFIRDHEMRRRVKLLVTPGRAEDILKSKIQPETSNSLFIASILKNVKNVPRFAIKSDLGDVSEAIRNKTAFFLPRVVIENGDVTLTKSALFNKDKKMVGVMDEWEIIGGKIINKSLKQGVVTISNPANPEKLVAFEILESSIKVASHLKDDKLWFTVDAKFVGNIAETTETEQNSLDKAFLQALEQALANQFTRQVEAAYHKGQEVKSEHLHLGGLVYRQHPDYWEKTKNNWEEEVFPTVPLYVNIKVTVRRPGLTS